MSLADQLEPRAGKCFLCKWILEDLRAHGKLTGAPLDYNGAAQFPLYSKVLHLRVEGIVMPEPRIHVVF